MICDHQVAAVIQDFIHYWITLVVVIQEVMYRRVSYVRNPYYDDHFDIPTERQRIGKTLTMITTLGTDLLSCGSPGTDQPSFGSPDIELLSRGSLLVGWALYEKLDRLIALLTQWVEDSSLSPVVTASVVCTTYLLCVSLPVLA